MSFKDQNRHWHMPAAYLKVFLQYAASRQLPIESLLSGTRLSADELAQSSQVISFHEIRQVLSNFTRYLGPGWHLALAQRLSVPSHGPLGFATVTAPDLRAAGDVLLRFIGIRGPFVWLAGATEGDRFVIRIYETTDMGEQRMALIELALLSIQVMLERPLGRELRGAQISFAYPEPDYLEKLEAVFHPGLEFNTRGHAISLPLDWLDEPCVLHDEAMHRYLVMRCEEDLRAVSGVLPAEIAVRQALLARPGKLPGLAEIASAQNVSPRTLIRRLKRGKTSYNVILEDVRKTLATDYLLRSDMSVSRIGYRLGYVDPSNFGRAFRGWYDTSPGRYRVLHRGT
jgi:AraC-like DNA-binding protein